MAIPLRDSWLAHALGGGDYKGGAPGRPSRHDKGGEPAPDASPSLERADAELVERLRAGDTLAFTELIATVVPALVRYAARLLQDAVAADDVVQDVLVRLWTRRTTITITTTLRAYLFGAVRNAVFNVHKHHRVVVAHAADIAAGTSSPDMSMSPSEMALERLTVDQLLAYLPERRREAVVLRYLGELSYAEIAAILGTTRTNAERLVARSLETLREIVGSKKE